MKRSVALLLALVMALCCACAEESADVVLMSVGGEDVMLSLVENYAYMLYYYGYTDGLDMLEGLEYVLRYEIAPKLLVSDPEALLGDEYAASVAEATEYYEDAIAEYIEAYAEEGKSEAELRLEAIDYYGTSLEDYVNGYVLSDAYEKLLENMDIEVSDEEAEALYVSEAEYQMSVITSVMMYEYYTGYGYDLYFTPAGYRGILHILIDADADLLSAYADAADETAIAEAKAAVIASVQPTLDEIYAAFENGTSFEELIAEYCIDPGMQDEDNLANGYAVNKDSYTWVSEFTEGSFGEEMQQPGDISNPVVTSYGVHILYYLRDIPEGITPITDELLETYRGYLRSDKQQEAADALLKEFEVVYTLDYDSYVGEDCFLSM